MSPDAVGVRSADAFYRRLCRDLGAVAYDNDIAALRYLDANVLPADAVAVPEPRSGSTAAQVRAPQLPSCLRMTRPAPRSTAQIHARQRGKAGGRLRRGVRRRGCEEHDRIKRIQRDKPATNKNTRAIGRNR